jgi:hypothetical protein
MVKDTRKKMGQGTVILDMKKNFMCNCAPMHFLHKNCFGNPKGLSSSGKSFGYDDIPISSKVQFS